MPICSWVKMAAQALLDEVNTIETAEYEDFGSAYAFAAVPARFALERGQWEEAATLTTLHPASLAGRCSHMRKQSWSLPTGWVPHTPVM